MKNCHQRGKEAVFLTKTVVWYAGWALIGWLILGEAVVCLAQAPPVQGRVVGTYCALCGRVIPAGQTCPHMGGGGGGGGSFNNNDAAIQAAGQLGQALGQALSQSIAANAQARRNEALALNDQGNQYYRQGQWQLAIDAYKAALGIFPDDAVIRQNLANAKQALEQERRAEEARKKQEIYDRLAGRMKLSEGTNGEGGPLTLSDVKADIRVGLSLKDMKLGDSDSDRGHVGIRGLPGIALNDDTGKGTTKPYGIPGLPGIYVNGPGSGSGITPPGRVQPQTATGDSALPATAANDTRNATPNGNGGQRGNLPGANAKNAQAGSDTVPVETAKPLTISGDSNPPPGQENNAPTQTTSSTGTLQMPEPKPTPASVPASLTQQADTSAAAAAAPGLEDASSQARLGFDTPLSPNNSPPAPLGARNSTTPVPSGSGGQQITAIPKTLFEKPIPGSAPVDLRVNGPSQLDVGRTESPQADNHSAAVREIIEGVNALAIKLGWSLEERARLEQALNQLGSDGDLSVSNIQIRRAWQDILTRGQNAQLMREASQAGGTGFPGAGTQTVYQDCVVFALANAAGLPYGVVSARAAELIRQGDWREAGDRANPQAAIEQKGLNGGEVIMLAESFGQAEVVPSSDFAKTLNEGRPIMVNVVPYDGDVRSGHEVVLAKTFQHNGETWFELMDSNQGPRRRLFLSSKELAIILQENGVAFRPEPGTTPKLLRNPGSQ